MFNPQVKQLVSEGWLPGPMPPNTWGWGGVVPNGLDPSTGFFFADFKGDKVDAIGHGELTCEDVKFYNNSLTMPPTK